MTVYKKSWVVLFGGGGREACVERMLAEGIDIHAIIVPKRRNTRLDHAIEKFRRLACRLLEVDREMLSHALTPFAGKGLLSIGFPYLISDDLLNLFQPAINLHPTLLPRYRGPTTAAYVLINNERESGSTVHYMTTEMDRGDIVAQSYVSLTSFDTIRSLQNKVYAQEPQLVIEALRKLEEGEFAREQDESQASEFPKKRTPADSEIDPSFSLKDLFNQIRACDPDDFPAFFYHEGEKVCIRLWRPEKGNGCEDEI